MEINVLDEDGLLEFVNFGFQQTVLNGLDDVALHLGFLDLEDL